MIECPATLTTQPSGARFPFKITIPPVCLIGFERGLRTCWPALSLASLASSPIVQQVHDHLPALEGHVVLPLIHGRDPVPSHRRNAEELERDRHGISRKLASTCARAWAGMVFEIFEFGIGHLAGRMFPDCFEHVLN